MKIVISLWIQKSLPNFYLISFYNSDYLDGCPDVMEEIRKAIVQKGFDLDSVTDTVKHDIFTLLGKPEELPSCEVASCPSTERDTSLNEQPSVSGGNSSVFSAELENQQQEPFAPNQSNNSFCVPSCWNNSTTQDCSAELYQQQEFPISQQFDSYMPICLYNFSHYRTIHTISI